jgi:endonuclease/exonuclease/phosphatase (EEP) superfamily protein YafD
MIDHRLSTLLAVALAIAGCAAVSEPGQTLPPETLGTHHLSVANGVQQCRAHLDEAGNTPGPELDAGNIRLLSWNVKKGSHAHWRDDLVSLASDKDLVLIQEAALRPDFTEPLTGVEHWAFGPGYENRRQRTGVMTFSRVAPLAHCNLSNTEPWLMTPKATIVTKFGLSDTDDTLIVVNIHAINFTFQLVEFRQQMDQIRQISENHRGPMILSGDFNTWRDRRVEVLQVLVDDLGLEPLTFEEDHRKKAFGQTLDHIFVRGLSPRLTETSKVQTSDHNPLSAELSM